MPKSVREIEDRSFVVNMEQNERKNGSLKSIKETKNKNVINCDVICRENDGLIVFYFKLERRKNV